MRITFLMARKILTYSDAMVMPLDRFIALEKMHSLILDIKREAQSGEDKTTTNMTKQERNETATKLAGLETVHFDDLDLPDHFKDVFS